MEYGREWWSGQWVF